MVAAGMRHAQRGGIAYVGRPVSPGPEMLQDTSTSLLLEATSLTGALHKHTSCLLHPVLSLHSSCCCWRGGAAIPKGPQGQTEVLAVLPDFASAGWVSQQLCWWDVSLSLESSDLGSVLCCHGFSHLTPHMLLVKRRIFKLCSKRLSRPLWQSHTKVVAPSPPAQCHHLIPTAPNSPHIPASHPSLAITSGTEAVLPPPAPCAQGCPFWDRLFLASRAALGASSLPGCSIHCWVAVCVIQMTFFESFRPPAATFSCQLPNMAITHGAHIKAKLPWCSSFHMLLSPPICPPSPFYFCSP